MSDFAIRPLPGASFGALVADGAAFTAAASAAPQALPAALNDHGGLLVVKGMGAISRAADLLVRLSRPFGPEVEDYAATGIRPQLLHPESSHIIRISNLPPMNFPVPARPQPPLLADGSLPTAFPHRRGWHTDQSYRRPPPDISLFYAHRPAPKGQGQTLYADGTGAWEALPARLKQAAAGLQGLHVAPFTGHGESDVRAGRPRQPLSPKDGPQPQPVVRIHPVTGKRALYLCEDEQMDWLRGPFLGMEAGPDGAGARLLYQLMAHLTAPAFTYVHDWDQGDLVIHDNRCTVHAATWFDAERHGRAMWRTTVWGHPGPEYRDDRRSWEAAWRPPPAPGDQGTSWAANHGPRMVGAAGIEPAAPAV